MQTQNVHDSGNEGDEDADDRHFQQNLDPDSTQRPDTIADFLVQRRGNAGPILLLPRINQLPKMDPLPRMFRVELQNPIASVFGVIFFILNILMRSADNFVNEQTVRRISISDGRPDADDETQTTSDDPDVTQSDLVMIDGRGDRDQQEIEVDFHGFDDDPNGENPRHHHPNEEQEHFELITGPMGFVPTEQRGKHGDGRQERKETDEGT